MPARDVRITIRNATSFALKKIKGNLCHGSFTDPFNFPNTIESGKNATWQAESGGDIPIVGSVGTGTEGWVKYQVQGFPDVITIYWDNPFVGNTFFGFDASSVDNLDPRESRDPSTMRNAPRGWNAGCGDDIQPADSTFEPPPSRFGFFAPYSAIDARGNLVGVTQGDIGDESVGLILPLPWQDKLSQHAWFDIGIRDLMPTSMMLVLKVLNVDPTKGMRAIAPGVPSFSMEQRLHV